MTIVQSHCGHQEGICQILGTLDLGVISKVTEISNTVYDKVPALGGRWQLILAVIQFPVIQVGLLVPEISSVPPSVVDGQSVVSLGGHATPSVNTMACCQCSGTVIAWAVLRKKSKG